MAWTRETVLELCLLEKQTRGKLCNYRWQTPPTHSQLFPDAVLPTVVQVTYGTQAPDNAGGMFGCEATFTDLARALAELQANKCYLAELLVFL